VPPPRSAPGGSAAQAAGFGTLDIRVQPAGAEVTIDGQKWLTSEEGHFSLQLPSGMHRIEIAKSGYGQFVREVDVLDGEVVPLNVSLMTAAP
jgi:uncharacterized membrane protein